MTLCLFSFVRFRAEFLSLLRTYNCFLKDQTQLHLTYLHVRRGSRKCSPERLSFVTYFKIKGVFNEREIRSASVRGWKRSLLLR